MNDTEKTDEKLLLKVTEALESTVESNKAIIKMARADEKHRRFKTGMLFLPIILMISLYFYQTWKSNNYFSGESYVALVEINGEINSNLPASAKNINASLQKAFKDEGSEGVLISINSPGGLPAESAQIHDEIKSLKKEYPKKKVVVFGSGSMTSGAYWIASASDEIHTLSMTMVGSIGVILENFNLSKIAEKYEISKNIFTAGENKHRLDMFVDPKKEDVIKIENMLSKLHVLFKNTVKESRGDKINLIKNPDLFSGDFWLGVEAVKLGLIDSVTTKNALLKDKFGTTNLLDYTEQPTVFDKFNTQRVFSELNNMSLMVK